jgi:hypothetical protein
MNDRDRINIQGFLAKWRGSQGNELLDFLGNVFDFAFRMSDFELF